MLSMFSTGNFTKLHLYYCSIHFLMFCIYIYRNISVLKHHIKLIFICLYFNKKNSLFHLFISLPHSKGYVRYFNQTLSDLINKVRFSSSLQRQCPRTTGSCNMWSISIKASKSAQPFMCNDKLVTVPVTLSPRTCNEYGGMSREICPRAHPSNSYGISAK